MRYLVVVELSSGLQSVGKRRRLRQTAERDMLATAGYLAKQGFTVQPDPQRGGWRIWDGLAPAGRLYIGKEYRR
jgi:hypothetical protein